MIGRQALKLGQTWLSLLVSNNWLQLFVFKIKDDIGTGLTKNYKIIKDHKKNQIKVKIYQTEIYKKNNASLRVCVSL